jgi:hypothetical protein
MGWNSRSARAAAAAGWLVLRAEFRKRWRTWLMLALIAGLFAGAVQTAAAGARRTDAAYPSLVAWSHPPDGLLYSFPGQSQKFGHFSMAAAARLPQVAQFVVLASYTAVNPPDIGIWAPETDAVPSQFWHRKILAGRLANPARPDEVNISFTVAEASHLGVGDVLRAALLTTTRDLAWFSFRIVGIDAAPGEFPPQYGTGSDIVWATPAFYREHHGDAYIQLGAAIRLRHGAADLPAVQREIYRLANGKVVNIYPLGPQAANTERSIHLQAVTLWALCGLLAVIGLLVLGQLVARLSFLDSAEYSTLVALGMSRRALFAVGLGRAAAVGAAGGVLGALLAVLASPVLPVGLAGLAEPQPGIHADGTVLALGLAGTILATMAGAAWPAWHAAGAGRARATAAAAGMASGRAGTAAAGRWAASAPRPPPPAGLGRDRRPQLGDRGDRPAARVAARSGPDGAAGAQHDRKRGRRRGCADCGAGLFRQPRELPGHAAVVRRHLGCLRDQPAQRRRQRGRPQRRRRSGGGRLGGRLFRCPAERPGRRGRCHCPASRA